MPKLKTNSGAAKRFKSTASGRFKRHKAMKRHILTSKGKGQKRRLGAVVMVSESDELKLKRLMPYG